MVDTNYFETDEFADEWYERLQAGEVARLVALPQKTSVQKVIDEEREFYINEIRNRKLGSLDI